MAIGIEAGASQGQCNTETASVHVVSRSKLGSVDGESRAVRAGHRICASSFYEKEERKRETPSLSAFGLGPEASCPPHRTPVE
jgi:hypothetical protein